MTALAPLIAEAPPSPGQDEAAQLAGPRTELDAIDDALHDLLMRRAAIVQRIADRKDATTTSRLRPGREAAIIRRLLRRHAGPLPPASIARVWRELLAGSIATQGAFCVAVCDTDPAHALLAAAREQFGALTPVSTHGSPLHAIGAVSAGAAAIAVLPVPQDGQTPAWWPALLHRDEPRIHIVARLPFWSRRPDGAPAAQAFVVGASPPDPSGDDRTLLGLELPPDMSRGRLAAALAAAGLTPGPIILQRDDYAARALADLPGFITADDPRLPALRDATTHTPVILGAYACPILSETETSP